MTIGFVRKLLKIFRGNVSPSLIVLSAILGVTFGMTPGFYGLHVALLAIALILNINLAVFLVFLALGKSFSFAAAPLLFQAGHFTQGSFPAVLEVLGSIPIVGITDFSRYAVAGAILLGPLSGLALGLLLMMSVVKFRRTWLKLDQNSQRFRDWHSRKWVRLLERILIGKRADPAVELARKPKYVRLPGVGLAVVVLAAAFFGLQSIKDDIVTSYTARSLTGVNGAQVDVAAVNLAPLAGKVAIRDLQMTDPAKPHQNRLAVKEMNAQVGLLDLSLGRIVMDDIVLANVRFDEPRAQPGAVLPTPPEPEPEPFDINKYKLSDSDIARLESYVQDSKALREWMDKIKKWLPQRKEQPPPPPMPQSYLENLTARAPRAPTPHVLVRRLSLEGVKVPLEQIGMSNILCSNLSDAPSGAGLPVKIEIKSTERPCSIALIGHYDQDDGYAEVNAEFADLDLQKIQAQLSRNNPVQFQGGTVSGRIEGRASREAIDLAIHVKTRGMRVQTAGRGVLGMDPEVTAEAMKVMENIETTLRLVGPPSEPRLVFDGPALTKNFRDALVRAGKDQLARRADALIGGRLPAGVPSAGTVIEDPLKAGKSLVGNLTSMPAQFGGKKKP